MKRPKRVAAIHDISAFGRCSLTVIMPILSAMGIQCCPVPTAVLSTHTGGFHNIAIKNTDEFMTGCFHHHQSLEIHMECIYSGFLAKASQIDEVAAYLSKNKSSLKVVDPVLGDCGKPYQTMTHEIIKKMRCLISKADIITPNPTEVSLLLNERYSDVPLPYETAIVYLKRLSHLGPSKVIITGIDLLHQGICNLGYDDETDEIYNVSCNYIPVHYTGTGDIFASVLIGELLNENGLLSAMEKATAFVEECIQITYPSGEPTRDGVFLEYALPLLYQKGRE